MFFGGGAQPGRSRPMPLPMCSDYRLRVRSRNGANFCDDAEQSAARTAADDAVDAEAPSECDADVDVAVTVGVFTTQAYLHYAFCDLKATIITARAPGPVAATTSNSYHGASFNLGTTCALSRAQLESIISLRYIS